MPNFELIDNFFQVTVLGFTAFIALILAYLHKSRRCLILSLAYACFFMGTLYYVLCLCITGDVPQVFYVAEISWIASYFFFFSLQIVRTENIRLHFLLFLPYVQYLLQLQYLFSDLLVRHI